MNSSKSTFIKYLAALLSGLLFGAGMIISQMVDPRIVIAFLDITGNWDPSLAFVMGGALSVFIPFYHFIIKPRKSAMNGDVFNLPSNNKVDKNLVIGAMLFGIGWGLVGICPGPAIASIGGGSNIIFTFILSLSIGIIAANKYLSKDKL